MKKNQGSLSWCRCLLFFRILAYCDRRMSVENCHVADKDKTTGDKLKRKIFRHVLYS